MANAIWGWILKLLRVISSHFFTTDEQLRTYLSHTHPMISTLVTLTYALSFATTTTTTTNTTTNSSTVHLLSHTALSSVFGWPEILVGLVGILYAITIAYSKSTGLRADSECALFLGVIFLFSVGCLKIGFGTSFLFVVITCAMVSPVVGKVRDWIYEQAKKRREEQEMKNNKKEEEKTPLCAENV